jgi:hypothetical protein
VKAALPGLLRQALEGCTECVGVDGAASSVVADEIVIVPVRASSEAALGLLDPMAT